ncbi:MAG: rod shape-determining protein MreC [Spirochaetaceae bacterium]|nr:rod shape-determining protein MreC [Spirochaetaceae bacterium]RKX68594.1 MAG: rod shape-determining protein MreC [Spirochaetota bacterium]RKX98085.1 MAG: rod shape-determining protein MreC [Spirochaetota bacterium]
MRERSDGGARPEAVLAILLIVSILLIIFSGPHRGKAGKEWGSRFVLGIQQVTGTATERIKDGFGSLRRLREIRLQYESALEKLGDYQGLERDLVELRRENFELKRQLGYSAGMDFNHIPARIIARDPSNLFSSITIDKGSADGLRVGAVATSFQDGFFGLLGKVITVARHSAQIRPVVDPDHYVAARLQRSRYDGLVEGRGTEGGELTMSYVRKSAGPAITVNDLVVTTGMQSLYPPGIVIGRIKEIRSRDYSTSLELILEPIIDVTRAEYVFILGGDG